MREQDTMEQIDVWGAARRAMQPGKELDFSIGALKVVVSFVFQRGEAGLPTCSPFLIVVSLTVR